MKYYWMTYVREEIGLETMELPKGGAKRFGSEVGNLTVPLS